MRVYFSLAVIAVATGLSLEGLVVDDRDSKNNEEIPNATRSKRSGRLDLLRRREEAVTFANTPPSDPLPDSMQNEKLSVVAPSDFSPDNNMGNEMLPIVHPEDPMPDHPEDPMPDHLKPEKTAILAPADLASAKKKTVTCVLMEAIYLFAPGFEPGEDEEKQHQWQCEFHEWHNAILTLKGLSQQFYERHQNKIESGETILSITYDAAMEDPNFDASNTDTFWIPKGSTLALLDAPEEEKGFRQRRKMAIAPEGNHTLLVIRVSDTFGNRPDNSAAQMSDDIFGTGLDAHNLRSQYIACSAGKLDFMPAEGENIVNGVAELSVPAQLRFQSSSVVENWVLHLAPDLVGALDQWTLVMFILPDTVNFAGAAAYTYVGSRHSVFLDQFSNNLLVLMHEIGHNLGNRHSGKGRLSYDDGTCMMGAHVYDDDAPRMCFNGAKSYYFGWYADAQVDINPKAKYWKGELVGVADYVTGAIKKDGSQYVVARIPSSTSPDLFLMYNRKKGINSQVTVNGNDVTVVQQDGAHAQSWLLAGLSARDKPFRFKDWDGNGTDLIVDVCSQKYGMPDYAEVAIYLDDGTEAPLCSPAPGGALVDQKGSNGDAIGAYKVNQGMKTVELPILSNENMYREKDGGSVRTSRTDVQNLFGPNWNMQSFRFESSDKSSIPEGVNIESAILLVYPSRTRKFLKREIYGQASGHAVGDASRTKRASNFLSKAPKTEATSDIGPGVPAWKPDRYEELVDVTSIIQEIVGRSDYKLGNSIEIFLTGSASVPGRQILTADTGHGPILSVQYKAAAAADADGESDESENEGGSQAPMEKEIELEVLEDSDDFAEASSGALRAASKFLWKDSVPMLAYRFQNVKIPQGTKILGARLEVYGISRSTMSADISGIIQGEDVGNSPPFKYKDKQLTEAQKTNATVEVANLPTWTAKQYNSLGDVTSIVQELVNREDFVEGNAIKLILSNKGSKSSRKVGTRETGNGAKLFIRYE